MYLVSQGSLVMDKISKKLPVIHDAKPSRTPIYLQAENTLPPELHSIFEQLVTEYRFASFKHHGRMFASPKVIAELVQLGWRNPS
jgi:hypothetical protein